MDGRCRYFTYSHDDLKQGRKKRMNNLAMAVLHSITYYLTSRVSKYYYVVLYRFTTYLWYVTLRWIYISIRVYGKTPCGPT